MALRRLILASCMVIFFSASMIFAQEPIEKKKTTAQEQVKTKPKKPTPNKPKRATGKPGSRPVNKKEAPDVKLTNARITFDHPGVYEVTLEGIQVWEDEHTGAPRLESKAVGTFLVSGEPLSSGCDCSVGHGGGIRGFVRMIISLL